MEENIWDRDGFTPDYAGNNLHIVLKKSNLLSGEDGGETFTGRVADIGVLTRETIVRDIVTLGKNEGVGYDTLLRLWDTAEQAVIDRLKRGFRVKGAVCEAKLGVRGTFASRSEKFNPEKHSIVPVFTAGEALLSALKDVKAETVQSSEIAPVITRVRDAESESEDTLTPGGILEVTGTDIRVAGEVGDEGVYFVNTADESVVKADMKKIFINNPAQICLVVPPLEAGSYKIRITTRYIRSTKVFRKDLLSAMSPHTLTVR